MVAVLHDIFLEEGSFGVRRLLVNNDKLNKSDMLVMVKAVGPKGSGPIALAYGDSLPTVAVAIVVGGQSVALTVSPSQSLHYSIGSPGGVSVEYWIETQRL